MASVYKKSGRWWLRFKGADGRWARRARKSHHEGPPRDSKRSNASGSRGSSVKAWLRATTTAGAPSKVTSRRPAGHSRGPATVIGAPRHRGRDLGRVLEGVRVEHTGPGVQHHGHGRLHGVAAFAVLLTLNLLDRPRWRTC